MQTGRRPLFAGIMAGAVFLVGAAAMAEQTRVAAGAPGFEYPLEQVAVRVTLQPGSAARALRRLSLNGSGTATLETGDTAITYSYPPGDLLALVNDLYRIRFFQMPDSYHARYSVFLKPDGMVGTSVLRMQDTASTRVCFSIEAFEKCVGYAADGPPELDEMVQRVMAEAERLSRQAAGGK